jgi:hypothetical protein
VGPDLGAAAAHPEHEVGARVHGGELLHPHVLEHSQHAELAVLVYQRVVGDDSEINLQRVRPGWW